jgi:hypothetical protein
LVSATALIFMVVTFDTARKRFTNAGFSAEFGPLVRAPNIFGYHSSLTDLVALDIARSLYSPRFTGCPFFHDTPPGRECQQFRIPLGEGGVFNAPAIPATPPAYQLRPSPLTIINDLTNLINTL